jgi:hypothetical protein
VGCAVLTVLPCFPLAAAVRGRYADLTECMDSISLEELIMAVRRQSQGFSRGTSSYRGVTHHPSGEEHKEVIGGAGHSSGKGNAEMKGLLHHPTRQGRQRNEEVIGSGALCGPLCSKLFTGHLYPPSSQPAGRSVNQRLQSIATAC